MQQVAIVGGGFSGALLAVNLLRHEGPGAILVERRARAGRGTAYSTAHPEHLLNVRAANMSAFPDDPDHFVRWLEARSEFGGSHFVPRRLYGDYLEELLATAARQAPHRLRIVSGDAVDVETLNDRAALRLSDGRRIDADHVVLALGNLPPATPAVLADLDPNSPVYIDNPWGDGLADGLGQEDVVMVLGTGLTMVDIVLTLTKAGFAGQIVAVSRRGLMPHAHDPGSPPSTLNERPAIRPSILLQALRARARSIPWRAAVDELRPYTTDIWRAMSVDERARFLRHLRPWWDVHRHRIAPAVAGQMAELRASGRLEIIAGRIEQAEPHPDGLRVTVRERGDARGAIHLAKRLINATGPEGSLARTKEPLLRRLRDRGVLRADPLAIGIDVDQDSRTIDDGGEASSWLHMIGPMTRGAFWEIVAVPDIRRQSWSLARRLSNAHWVEGSGL